MISIHEIIIVGIIIKLRVNNGKFANPISIVYTDFIFQGPRFPSNNRRSKTRLGHRPVMICEKRGPLVLVFPPNNRRSKTLVLRG